MKSPWVRLIIFVMILGVMAPWLLPGYATAEVRDWNQLEDPLFETNFDPIFESAAYIDTAGGPAGIAPAPNAD